MNEAERFTIDELLARYELEPSLRDVYVEGGLDRDVLQRHYAESDGWVIYQIDLVNVPSALLNQHGLTDGNKQRVIALARELAHIVGEPSYRCLVDRDADHWYGPLEQVPRLRWTKYCSIEMYFFTKQIVRDLIIVAAKVRISDFDLFFTSFTRFLADMFAMRLADRDLGWGMNWIDPEKFLSIVESQMEFDQASYVERLLNKNSRHRSKASFEERFTERRALLVGDPREFIRGHDFVCALARTVEAARGVKTFSSVETLERFFVYKAVDVAELAELLI